MAAGAVPCLMLAEYDCYARPENGRPKLAPKPQGFEYTKEPQVGGYTTYFGLSAAPGKGPGFGWAGGVPDSKAGLLLPALEPELQLHENFSGSCSGFRDGYRP